jgi:hypothetical protein
MQEFYMLTATVYPAKTNTELDKNIFKSLLLTIEQLRT